MSAPLPRSLLPGTAGLHEDRTVVGGCDLVELAGQFGTPLFVYDEEHLRRRCREAVAAFGDGVAYATKAFLCGAMARLAHEEGMHLDVATGGELYLALHAGVPAQRLVLHGNNKSAAELHMALDAGVGRVVVDSFDEMVRIEELVSAGLAPPNVLVRINPGIDAHTHEYLKTGKADSKFGFPTGPVAAEAIRRAAESDAMHLVGIHAHIGSQVFEAGFFARAVRELAPTVAEHRVAEFSIGGGLGVAYVAGEVAPTITEWGAAVHQAVADAGIEAKVLAEPGRSIVAAAAVTLYTVGTIKEIPGVRTYVSVDGGMSDNPRPVLYGSGYEAFLPRAPLAERPERVRIVGKHCESGDLIVDDAAVPAGLAVGDVLATPVTGAYGISMGSNYNLVRRPAVVFVGDGNARLVLRRESYEDLLTREV